MLLAVLAWSGFDTPLIRHAKFIVRAYTEVMLPNYSY
jgi:hypothetical protein